MAALTARICVAPLVGVLLLAGCGGSARHRETERQLRVPGTGPFTATTVRVRAGSPAVCRRDAEAFTRAAAGYLLPFPSDADVYFHQARLQFLHFEAHLCDVAVLRETISHRLTPKERRAILADLTFLGETARELGEVGAPASRQ